MVAEIIRQDTVAEFRSAGAIAGKTGETVHTRCKNHIMPGHCGREKYEIKENRKNVIEIPIDGTMTSEVKIEFLKTKPATTGKNRLLSEVEIY